MTDVETQAAIDALARRLRTRDNASDEDERADAEVFALEFLTALRSQGWRPTEAKRRVPGLPSGVKDPAAAARGAAMARELLEHRNDDDPDAAA
jgi:hypothetical protein